MYLISLYFDEKSNNTIQSYINKTESITDNYFMSEHHVPPHLTLMALHTHNEDKVIEVFNTIVSHYHSFSIDFMSIGMFKGVLYISPLLSYDMHLLQNEFYNQFKDCTDISLDYRYLPFQYLPHITIAKTLDDQQTINGSQTLYKLFTPFKGRIISIGLSKTNPYENLIVYNL